MKEIEASTFEVLLGKLLSISPFVFPLYLFRFTFAGIPFTFLEGYCYLVFGLFFIGLVTKKISFNWLKPLRPYYYLALTLLLGATLGVVMAPHLINLPSGELLNARMAALGVWKGWVLAPILYFLTFTQVINTPKKINELLTNFVYSGALVALVSYGFVVFADGMTYDLRLSGFFESANYLSLYIVPALLLSFYTFFQGSPNKKHRLLNLASLTVMGHALFMTKSYAAVIGVFGALGLYILFTLVRQVKSLKKRLIAFAVLLVIFIVVMITQLNSPKLKQFLDWENRSSTSVRLEVYEISAGLIGANPLIGVGPGLFQAYYQTEGPVILERAPMEWNIPHPHNIFLAFWLNAGILGLFALLGFLFLAHRHLTYPILAFWGILIHGLFDTPFWKNDLAMIFWLILGSILILQTHAANTSKESKSPLRKRATIRVSSSAKAKRI